MKPTFDILLLIARPAAGKSEVIHYLKNTSLSERQTRFHIGKLEELDDFPMLWTWFEEDALLERMGYPRLHTDAEGYFLGNHLWDLLIERIGLDYQKKLRDVPGLAEDYTTLVEFSRGTEHGGYASAFNHLSREMAEKMAVLYLDVSWQESLRKNRKRFNPSKPDSILEHSLPDAKLERLYKEVDWAEVSAADPQYLNIQGVKVPFVVFDNADDVTSRGGEELGERLHTCLDKLWVLFRL
ncbi:MAG: hypothetical protein VB013_00535 [Anaerolineaceae bacterium]|nr:hypothetical protein [Anaerolineaceae bacterium]